MFRTGLRFTHDTTDEDDAQDMILLLCDYALDLGLELEGGITRDPDEDYVLSYWGEDAIDAACEELDDVLEEILGE